MLELLDMTWIIYTNSLIIQREVSRLSQGHPVSE